MPDRPAGDDRAPADTTASRHEVVVPLRLYKTVTAVSTLAAVVFVVMGFVVLDGAVGLLGGPTGLLGGFLANLGVGGTPLEPYLSVLGLAFAVVGLGFIAFGAFVYVYASRFRAEEMGKSKDDAS